MTSVRTVTTVQTSGGHSGQNDNNLDALLEDLQTSVLRGKPATLNGGGSAKTKIYREVTRTVKHETKPGGYQQVEYLAPANTTTVVAERAPSPAVDLATGTAPGMTSYKTVSYETYNNSSSGKPASSRPVATEDAGFGKNLTELDSLLEDLHHAQRVGFGSDHGSRGRSRTTDVVPICRGGVDPCLLEPIDFPPPPPREQMSRSVERSSYQTYSSGSQKYQQPEPKRSSSVNRELIFNESTRSDTREQNRATRSPSPLRQPESPQVPRRNVHKEVYYEKTSTGGSTRQGRSTSSPQHQERYRDKSPSNQRLHREMYGYDNRTTSVPASPRLERNVEMSPPSQRRQPSPSPVRDSRTTVRSYNYNSTHGSSSSTNNTTTTSPRPYRSPSPIANRSPYVENAPIVELPRRSPSPKIAYQGGTPTKVTTTVRTYTYELPPGQTGYPPGSGYSVQEPIDHPDKPLTYQVSQPKRDPEPTVITYKYSSHNVNKYQGENNPDDRPRPFPTPSPTPGQNGEPPKKLDDLMASFGDAEMLQQRKQPPGYFTSERQTSETRTTSSSEPNGVAVVAPSSVKPPPATPATPDNGVRNRGNSRNVAGPPVYYPPGVELFAQKEQEAKMESIRANGEWEKSREKESKGSSGGAGVVPVCLPVCCAMPCSIM